MQKGKANILQNSKSETQVLIFESNDTETEELPNTESRTFRDAVADNEAETSSEFQNGSKRNFLGRAKRKDVDENKTEKDNTRSGENQTSISLIPTPFQQFSVIIQKVYIYTYMDEFT